MAGFRRGESTDVVAESRLGAWQSMRMSAAGSLSMTWDPLEMRDTTRVSLWDELSCTDVGETHSALVGISRHGKAKSFARAATR